jgi:hypothetical protein
MHSDGSGSYSKAESNGSGSFDDDMEYDSGSDYTETSSNCSWPPRTPVDNSPSAVAARCLKGVAPKALHCLITLEKELAVTIEICYFVDKDTASDIVRSFSIGDATTSEISINSSGLWNTLGV